MKSLSIALNILLIIGSCFSLFSLWAALSYVDTERSAAATQAFTERALPKLNKPVTNRALFDVIPPVVKVSSPVVEDNMKSVPDSTATAMDIHAYHLKGIFTSGANRFALIQEGSGKNTKAELLRITEGAGVADFTVTGIEPRMVNLTHTDSGEIVWLKVFSRIENGAKLMEDPIEKTSAEADKTVKKKSRNRK